MVICIYSPLLIWKTVSTSAAKVQNFYYLSLFFANFITENPNFLLNLNFYIFFQFTLV
jgi:hypothetical protein